MNEISRVLGILSGNQIFMSLAELIALVNKLNQSDTLSLFKLVATKIPNAELQAIFSAPEYPVWSPYDSTEYLWLLLQILQDAQDASGHAQR